MTSTRHHIKTAQHLDLSVMSHLHPDHHWPSTPATIWSVYASSAILVGCFAISPSPQGPTAWPTPWRLDFLAISPVLQLLCIDYLITEDQTLAFCESIPLDHPSPTAFAQQVLWRSARHAGIEARLARGMTIVAPETPDPTTPLWMQHHPSP